MTNKLKLYFNSENIIAYIIPIIVNYYFYWYKCINIINVILCIDVYNLIDYHVI